jgi:hypothetical protein
MVGAAPRIPLVTQSADLFAQNFLGKRCECDAGNDLHSYV